MRALSACPPSERRDFLDMVLTVGVDLLRVACGDAYVRVFLDHAKSGLDRPSRYDTKGSG